MDIVVTSPEMYLLDLNASKAGLRGIPFGPTDVSIVQESWMNVLRDEALRAVDTELRNLGFRPRRRSGPYMKNLTEGVHGWIGLPEVAAGLPGVFGLNATVGVRHDKFGAVLAELNPLTRDKSAPTVACHLGHLMPGNRFVTWQFTAPEDRSAVAADLRSNIEEYGLPFIQRMSDWSEVSKGLQNGELTVLPQQVHMNGAVAKIVDGDVAGARALISRELVEIGNRTDMYAESYRDFAKRFQERYEPV